MSEPRSETEPLPCVITGCPNKALHRVLFMSKSAGPTYDHLDLCARHGQVVAGKFFSLDTDPQKVWDHWFPDESGSSGGPDAP